MNIYIEKIYNFISSVISSQRIVPFASGLASIGLLRDILKSNLEREKYYIAILSCLVIFSLSIISYSYLSKIEKDKDVQMLDMTKRIIEAVFKHFGVEMAKNDAKETATTMNPIMQTIVNLVKEFQKLAEKGYKN